MLSKKSIQEPLQKYQKLSANETSFQNSSTYENEIPAQLPRQSKDHLVDDAVIAQTLPQNHQDSLEANLWSACNMYKHRVIEAKPTLLTPKSASKIYGSFKASTNIKTKTPSQSVSSEKLTREKVNIIGQATKSFEASESLASDLESCETASIDRALSLISNSTVEDQPASLSSFHVSPTFLPSASLQLQNQRSWDDSKSESIQISPTVSFPVSRIANDDFYQNYHPLSPPLSVGTSALSSINGDIESVDQSSEISTYSYNSSVSFNQELALHPDLYSLQTRAQRDKECQCQHEKEVKELKSALKLSEADTAILVSSKQQLQLDNHDLNETVKTLNNELSKLQQKVTEKDVNIAILKRNNSTSETKSAELLQIAEENLQALHSRLDETTDKLDFVSLENEKIKHNHDETSQKHEIALAANKSLEDEVKHLMAKCAELDSCLNANAVDSMDNTAYMTSLREERDNYAVKLHSQEQDLIKKQISLTQLEEKLTAANEQHSALSVSYQTLLQVSKTKESTIASLQSQLAAKDKEKQALDGAIVRLHDDLFRVEASFTKIKSEMVQKTRASNQEMSIKQHFEKQIVALKNDLKRVQNDCKVFTQKISDKNNQISQLSEQLKRSLLGRKKGETEIKNLKSELVDKQRSWKEALEKEKKLSNTIEQKSRHLSKKDEMILSSAAAMEELKSKFTQSQEKLQDSENQLIAQDKEITSLKDKLETLNKNSMETGNMLESKNNMINELEKEIERCLNSNTSLNQQLENLKMVQEKLQHTDSPDDHLASVVSQLQAARRDISERNNELELENKTLRVEFDKLKELKDKLEAQVAQALMEKQKLQKDVGNIQEELMEIAGHLKESRKNETTSRDKFSQLQEDFALLKDQQAATKYSLTQSKIELKSKIKELSALSRSNTTLTEELETAKMEMNAANLKLVELMSVSQENNDDQEKLELFERLHNSDAERMKLNEAVVQQQRYIASLQLHYQKWVNDATVKFNDLQAMQQQKPSKLQQDVGSQTSHEDKPIPSSPLPTVQTSQILTTESFTQTYHDEKPLSPSPVKKAARIENLCTSYTKCGSSVIPGPQGDALLYEATCPPTSYAVPAIAISISTQTDHLAQTVSQNIQTNENLYEKSRDSISTKLSKSVACQFKVESGLQSTQTEKTYLVENSTVGSSVGSVSFACQTDIGLQTVVNDRSLTLSRHCDVATETFLLVANSSCQTEEMQSPRFSHCATQTLTQHSSSVFPFLKDSTVQTESVTTENLLRPLHFRNSTAQTDDPAVIHAYVHTKISDPDNNAPLLKESTAQAESVTTEDLQRPLHLQTSPTQTDRTTVTDAYAQTEIGDSDENTFQDNFGVKESAWRKEKPGQTNFEPLSERSFLRGIVITSTDSLTQTEPFKVEVSHADTQTTLDILPDESNIVLPSAAPSKLAETATQTELDSNIAKTTSCTSSNTTSLSVTPSNVVSFSPIPKQDAASQFEIHWHESSSQTENDGGTSDVSPPTKRSEILAVSVPYQINIFPAENKNEHTQTNDEGVSQMKNIEIQTLKTSTMVELSLSNKFTQTEHGLHQAGSANSHSAEVPVGQNVTTQTIAISMKSVSCSADIGQEFLQGVSATNDVSRSDSETQTNQNENAVMFESMQNQANPNDYFFSICGRSALTIDQKPDAIDNSSQTDSSSVSLPQFPDPNDFLNHINSEDKAKLQAYKQTVKVLRTKLKQAEKQLAASKEKCNSLNLEIKALQYSSSAEKVLLDQAISDKETNSHLEQELLQWKESSRQRDELIESLQAEIELIQKRHGAEKEKIRRKSKADRMIKEKKIKEVNDRLKMLVEANDRLRKNVDKLQIKLTASNKQLDACQREKLRYQYRARKLQADLRSLSWIASSTPEQDTNGSNSENAKEQQNVFELPPAVQEIDCILKDLRKEIGVLEEQLNHHSSAVQHSNASLKELRSQDNSGLNCSGSSAVTETADTIAPAAQSEFSASLEII